jgi:hypothetical protein
MLLPFLAVYAKFVILIRRAEGVSQFIIALAKLIYTSIMAVSQSIRNKARSVWDVKFEPQDLELINEDPAIRVSFEQAGCTCFCERIKGYNVTLAEQFTLNFTGVSATIVGITFQVMEVTLSVVMEIPSRREKWFKGMPLDMLCYKDFIKPERLNQKIGADIPSQYLLDPFEKLLKIIRRYFTCEGRFDMVYPYHIRLLMHFTGKNTLNLPFFLCQSLGNMANNVRAKVDQSGNNLFHFSLIKMLVVEELRHLNKDCDSFLISANIPREPKGDIPLSTEKSTLHSAEARKEDVTEKRKGKELEDLSFSQPTSQKKSRPRLTNKTEEIQAPNKPRTNSVAKRFPMHIVQLEHVEGASKGIHER